MSTAESSLGVASTTRDLPSHIAETGAELKRGAFLNTIAMLASNFRAVFTLLIARLLGPASLGIFSVAWATMDLFSKVGILGLDDAITTFIARAEALGDRARSRTLFRVAVVLAVVQSALVAIVSIPAIRLFRQDLHLEPDMVSALVLILCALPGVALYRISNSVSRGMRVMKHDIYSRGLTEPGITTLAFLLAGSRSSRRKLPRLWARRLPVSSRSFSHQHYFGTCQKRLAPCRSEVKLDDCSVTDFLSAPTSS
jgi:Polysaccharide biosynthesis protein